MKRFKAIPLAITSMALGLGVTSQAHAAAYALSYDHIVNGVVDIWQPDGVSGATCSLINSGIGGVAACSGGTVGVNTAAPPNNTSAASATLNGSGPSTSDVGTGLRDAAPANTGSAVGIANNTFTPFGFPHADYSRGDAQVISEESISGNTAPASLTSTIEAKNIAEGLVNGSGTATGHGNNGSGTLTQITISLASPGQVGFRFEADPFMAAILSLPSIPAASSAKAVLSASVTITPQNGSIPVFAWAPDGALGGAGILNGTEVSDPASLNLNIEQQIPGAATYDPSGDGIGGATAGVYEAYSNSLNAGIYTITIAMSEDISVISEVPEPGSLALLGAGLVGVGVANRRRRRKA